MRAILRPAHPEDFDYCARLYFAGMDNIIKELNLNMDAQIADLRQRWDVTQVRMVTFNSAEIGWVQSFVKCAVPGAAVCGRPVPTEGNRY